MIGTLPQFTLFHVVISVVGIIAGLVVVGGLMSGRRLDGWIAMYLVTTFLTNLTGFGFPFVVMMPSHIIGGLSLALLPVVAFARYVKKDAGVWRGVFVIGSVTALYFNTFVLVVQLFKKVPAMIALAPTQSEPPFAVTQLLVLAMFVVLGRAANKGYRGA